jgi:ribose/xylose/arabinose/galactoside ABC-type transport system permease subunit
VARTVTRSMGGAHQQQHTARIWHSLAATLQRQGALIALLILLIFGTLRYSGFLSLENIFAVVSYNTMFALIALGMTFVIMTGGIDLSVGAVAALASVIGALMSPHGLLISLGVCVAAGILVGAINGWTIAWLKIPPFIATLAMMLAARGVALILANIPPNNSFVSVDTSTDFVSIGTYYIGPLPIPLILLTISYGLGSLLLNLTRFGRRVLAVGGNEEAARLMGLPVERIQLLAYVMSGALAALAGVLLAAQTNTGLPTEGVGWELTAIASVVVGGTLLTGGRGSVATTLVGVLLLGFIFNILNFENGRGFISLSSSWQLVVRGLFLLVVILLQSRLNRQQR